MRSVPKGALLVIAFCSICFGADARRKDHHSVPDKATPELAESSELPKFKSGDELHDKRLVAQDRGMHTKPGHGPRDRLAPTAPLVAATSLDPGLLTHSAIVVLQLVLVLVVARMGEYRHAASALALIFSIEALAYLILGGASLSVALMIAISVVFTINPIEDSDRLFKLHMGTVPILCVLWLGAVGILTQTDLIRALYGTDSLRPYHLVVMFLGSVYLCTALERSGFLHTAAVKVVSKYGRSPWGLFWALACFSGMLTVLIPGISRPASSPAVLPRASPLSLCWRDVFALTASPMHR